MGVLERKANATYIGREVVIGKESKGDTKVRGYFPLARQRTPLSTLRL